MFVGHYSVALAAKAADPRLPLWALFLAAQLVDIGWAALVLGGVEDVRLVEGFTASNHLEFVYYPFSHSLTAGLGWAAAAGLLWTLLARQFGNAGSAILIAAVVLSHWFLDVVVHVPDVPLYGDQHKVGFGLWNQPYLALAIEAAMFFVAAALYMRATHAVTRGGSYAIVVFGLFMLGGQAYALFAPVPPSVVAVGVSSLVAFSVFALLAGWVDRKRAN